MGQVEILASPDPGRVRPVGVFASPELEAEFRRRHAPHDLAVARCVILVGGLAAGGFVAFDLTMFPWGGPLAALIAVRAVVVLASLLALRGLRPGTPPATFDRVLTAWVVVMAAFDVVSSAIWPAGNAGGGILTVLMVVLLYSVVPLSVVRTAAVGVALSLGAVAVLAVVNPGGDADLAVMLACGMAIANVLGFVTSRRLHLRQRELFLALVEKAALADGLEKAAAEIRTLRGLFRVCAWCKGIHTDAGWQQLEDYVKANSYAEFTHGICPGCTAVHFGEAGAGATGSKPEWPAPV